MTSECLLLYYVYLCELSLYDVPRHCFGLYVFGLMYILTRFVEHFSNREYVFGITALLCTSVARCYCNLAECFNQNF